MAKYQHYMEMDTTFIYALNDPETGECRYVGKSDNPKERLKDHLYDCRKKKHYCANWINSLLSRGLVPLLEILQEVPKENWELWERVWIKASRRIGMNLTNATDGGENPPPSQMFGKQQTLEARAKISTSLKGHKHSPETCAKIGARHLGRKHSPEHRAKLSAAHKGKIRSPEHQAKLTASQLGRKRSPETCAKMSAIQKIKMQFPEHRARLAAFRLGTNHSLETRSKMSAAQKIRREREKNQQFNFPNE